MTTLRELQLRFKYGLTYVASILIREKKLFKLMQNKDFIYTCSAEDVHFRAGRLSMSIVPSILGGGKDVFGPLTSRIAMPTI